MFGRCRRKICCPHADGEGEEVLAPDAQELEERHDRHRAGRHRHHHVPEALQPIAAVDPGGVLEVAIDAPEAGSGRPDGHIRRAPIWRGNLFLHDLLRLFLPFRSEGQDQLTQERPLGFVCASTWLEGAPPERPPRFCGSALSWRRSQMRLDCHDCLSTGRVIDVAK